jgi:hypothetical protein
VRNKESANLIKGLHEEGASKVLYIFNLFNFKLSKFERVEDRAAQTTFEEKGV